MTRFLAILAALTCAASAQTYRTVTADTNNVIRTNFTLGAAQVSGSFAISNITGLQSALDGKLATNGSAAGLTNFPGSILQTNSSLSAFPAGLLRTNGDGSGLTNLPNANLSNATGVLPLANGGTGQTNAALAIEALLPAYTNNASKILALNSNATALIWTTNLGGGATYSNSVDALNGLGFGSTNNNSINLFNNGGTNEGGRHTVIGSGASAFGVSNVWQAVVIGAVAEVTNGGVAIGSDARAENGVAVGPNATADGSSVAFGRYADAQGGTVSSVTNIGSVAVGTFAVAFPHEGVAVGSASQTEGRGIAIGHSALAQSNATYGGTAVGFNSDALGGGVAVGDNAITTDGVAIGYAASANGESIAIGAQAYNGGFATNAIQIGRGTNTNDNTIQFYNAGIVGTNQWKALADSTTFGNLFMSAPTNGSNGQVAALNSNATALIWTNITASYPSFSNNAAKVLAVSSNEAGVEWIAVSNTVTDASTLTNFPASILQTNSADASFPAFLLRTNGSAAGLTSFPASLLTTNGDASGLTNFPTLNQNTTGTASNVTGVVAIANGGSGQTTAAAAIEAFLPSYAGNADRILALNSNATGLIWTTNAGGGGLTSPVAVVDGGTGATNATTALTNLGIFHSTGGVKIGGTVFDNSHTAVGQGSQAGADGIGTSVVAIGSGAKTYRNNTAQIGNGEIGNFSFNANNVQFFNWGLVDSNEWAALANAGTVGTNLLRSASITNAQAAIFTATTTNAPTNTNAPTPDAWLDIRVGTNDYKLPLWQ